MTALALVTLLATDAPAQRTPAQTPNTRAPWTQGRFEPVFTFSHRFEVQAGGDELLNFPTLSLGLALGRGVAAGLDFTSNSEVDPGRLGGNETQYWLSWLPWSGTAGAVQGLVAWNGAAESVDGALTVRGDLRRLSLVGELRAFSDAYATGDPGAAGAVGAILRLTSFLALSGDVGKALEPDTLGTVWSGGVAVAIPGTPHTLSFQATNGGATTLQGVSRRKVLGSSGVRWGFAFTVPLGSASQWGRIFSGGTSTTAATAPDSAAARVELRNVAFSPREVRIRVGQAVEWVNADPMVHSVNADDGTWKSEFLQEKGTFRRTFARAGRYPYHCAPHPQMTGVVIVE